MATDAKAAPKTPTPTKYESFVEDQLGKARQRIGRHDLAASLLLLLASFLGYLVLVGLLDLALELPAGVRVACLGVYTLAMLAWVSRLGWRLLREEVNPYFAARRLEETLPASKNSVLNWLDLRRGPLPSAIRGSLGRFAARDLKQADLDRAVSPRRLLWVAGAVAALVLTVAVWFALGPGQFLSLVRRALLPFEQVAIATTTQLDLMLPKGGHVTLTREQDVPVRVKVTGRVPAAQDPHAPKLHFRYAEDSPFSVRPLSADSRNPGEWLLTLKKDVIKTGLFYKVSAGDAETDEYRIEVVPRPRVVAWQVTLEPRPYLGEKPATFDIPNAERKILLPHLQVWRGTKITVRLRTNRPWHQGNLMLEQANQTLALAGEPVADDPQARTFHWVMDRKGSFKVLFKTSDGEENVDRDAYKLDVIADEAPQVTLTKPAQDVTVPANGTLPLAGFATDDVGVASLRLQVQVVKGDKPGLLTAKPYLPGHDFQLIDKSYPRKIDYKDFLALDGLKDLGGQPVTLAQGHELEVWLEALDACDYPKAGGNLGKSEKRKVLIGAPEKDAQKQQQERKKAADDADKQKQKQDAQQKKQNKDIQQQQDDQANPKPDLTDQQKDDLKKQQEKLKEELDKQEKQSEAKSKGDKSKGDKKDGSGDGAGAGENKDGGDGQGAGQKKEGGQDGGQGQAKSGEPPDQQPGAGGQGDSKSAGKPGDAGQPQAKADPGQGDDKKGDAKDGGGDPAGKAAQDKGAGAKDAETNQSKNGDAKPGKAGEGVAKSDPPAGQKGEKKAGDGKSGEGSAKDKGMAAQNNAAKAGPPEGQPQTAADSKTDPPGAGKRDATRADVDQLKKDMQDRDLKADAEKDLERVRDQARDPEVRKAADDALKQAREARYEPGSAKDKDAVEDKQAQANAKGGEKIPGTPGGAAKPGDDPGGQAKGPPDMDPTQTGQAKDKGKGMGGFKPGKTDGGPEDGKAHPADAQAGKRAGNLQLEDWQRVLTPDLLKKMNWTDADKTRFLDQMRQYEESLKKQARPKVTPQDKLGGGPKGVGVGPQKVGGGQTQTGPDQQSNRRPPEFEEAYQRFLQRPEAAPEKKAPPQK